MICNSINWQGLQLPALDLFIAIFGFSFRDLAFNTRWIFCMLSTLGIWWLLVAYSDIFRWTGDLFLNTMSFWSLLNRTSLDKYRANNSHSAVNKERRFFSCWGYFYHHLKGTGWGLIQCCENTLILSGQTLETSSIFTIGPSFKSPRAWKNSHVFFCRSWAFWLKSSVYKSEATVGWFGTSL